MLPQLCEMTAGRPAIIQGIDSRIYHAEDVGIVHLVIEQWSAEEWKTVLAALRSGFKVMLEARPVKQGE